MPNCCGKAGSCACKIEAGRNTTVTGSGSSQDPFVLAADVALAVEDTTTFDIVLTGAGTLASPWTLSVQYAQGASLGDLPDVDVSGAADAQVLSYDLDLQKWVAAPPAVAEPGGMTTDTSLTGDGSVADQLEVRPDAARYLTVTVDGVGISDAGINRMLRIFPDAPTRDAATPAPVTNTLSMLGTSPGRLDYWTGSAWESINNGISLDVQPGEMLTLSGSYAGGEVVQYVAQVATDTGVDGSFEVIPAVDLGTYAGVLAVSLQPLSSGGAAWTAMLDTDTDRIVGIAYRSDDGTAYAGASITAVVTALLY